MKSMVLSALHTLTRLLQPLCDVVIGGGGGTIIAVSIFQMTKPRHRKVK